MRDKLAERLDVPPFRVLGNKAMLQLAERRPRSDRDLLRVDGRFHSWKGEASGGTIETMFTSMEAKSAKGGFGRFSLNPKNTVSKHQLDNTSDRVSVKKIKYLNGYTGPFVMALPNTRTVRRSAALSKETGKYYGKDFVYSEGPHR